jgi:hypothetical protein
LGVLAVLMPSGTKLTTDRLRAGYWLLFLLIGAALATVAPGGIIYFLIPPAAVLLGIIASRWSGRAETIGALAGLLLLYLSWGELLAELEDIFSPGPLWVVAPAAAMIIIPVLVEARGLLVQARRGVVLLGSALVTFLFWAIAGAAPAYSRDRQQRFTIEHVTDAASKRSHWSVLDDGAALPKAYRKIADWRRGKLPYSERKRWLAEAPAERGILPPAIRVLETVRHGNDRTVRLRLIANGAERIVLLVPPEARVRAAGVAGFIRPAGDSASESKTTITCTGRACDGLELRIDFGSAKPVVLTLAGARNGLPRQAAPLVAARPPFARPQYTPDQTVAFTRVKL